MAKPVILYPWDSGGLNLVAPTGTHQTNGFVSSEIPTSGEANALAQNTWLWLSWLIANVATVTRNKFPQVTLTASGVWAPTITNQQTGSHYGVACTTAGKYITDLDVPSGYKVSTLTLQYNNVTGGSPTLTLTVEQNATLAATAPAIAATLTIATSVSSTGADVSMNLLTSSAGLTVTVAAAGGTYTRSAGSFITDGNFVGQVVQWAGFVNGGNNALKTITALTATVMTVSTTGLVNETGTAGGQSVSGVSPTVDGTFQLALGIASSGSAITVSGLRYTCVPQ